MSIPLRCRCGQVQGEVGTGRTYARASCYYKDCRADPATGAPIRVPEIVSRSQ